MPDPVPESNYVTLMMETLLRAQEVQRTMLREALAPGGDPVRAERILRGMDVYLR